MINHSFIFFLKEVIFLFKYIALCLKLALLEYNEELSKEEADEIALEYLESR